jgi:hypothetical protein
MRTVTRLLVAVAILQIVLILGVLWLTFQGDGGPAQVSRQLDRVEERLVRVEGRLAVHTCLLFTLPEDRTPAALAKCQAAVTEDQ